MLTSETRLAASGGVAISGDTAVVNNQVFVRGANGWVPQQTLADSGGALLDGNTLLIGTNIYSRTGTNWSLQGTLPIEIDYWYASVAISGDTIVVGRALDGPPSRYFGAVYVFVRNGTNWTPQATLVASDASNGLGLGLSVAISGDRIVAGAPGVSAGDPGRLPAAYVFARNGTNWVQQAKLTNGSLNNTNSSQFGQFVAMNGNSIAVGDANMASSAGPVSVFVWNGNAWGLQQQLSWAGGVPYNEQLRLNGDGLVASDNAGAIHVFGRNGTVWSEQQILTSGAGFWLGSGLALGTNAVVVDAPVSGGAYIYEPQSWSWQSQDIGEVSAAGSFSVSSNTVTVSGSGADINGTADAFRYVYRAWSGNVEMIAKVTQIGSSDTWARAGLMFRGSLDPSAAHAYMMLTKAAGSGLQDRITPGGSTDYTFGSWAGTPMWLKLVKLGSTLAAYQSPDGVAWSNVASVNINLPDPFYIGLAVTSHQDGTLCPSVFERVDITSSIDAVPQAATGVTAVVSGVDRVDLSWTDNSVTESGFAIKRNSSIVATLPPNTTNFTDTGLYPGTTYSYKVQAVAHGGSAPDSSSVTVTTWKLPQPWQSQDIGAVGVAGDAIFSFGVPPQYGSGITVTGSGDIADPADSFHYVFQPWSGNVDFRATAEFHLYYETDPASMAGLMIRSSLDPAAPYVMMTLTAGQGSRFQVRGTDGHTWGKGIPGYFVGALRLVRIGNTFSAYDSENDGWNLIAQTNLDLPTNVYVGFAVTSHHSNSTTAADFSQMGVFGGSDVYSSTPPVLSAYPASGSEIDLSWTDTNTNRTQFAIEAWPPNRDWTALLATLPSNVTSFANPGLSPSSPWNYRLRVRFPNGDWLCSNIANATTEPAAGGLPPPWAHRDVGIVGTGGLGFVSASNGLYAISGSGADIGGTSDAFQFAYQSWKGDGYLTARLTQMGASGTGLDPWAKFGLMFRQSLDAGSPNAFVFFSGNNGPGFQGRTASNGGTSYVAGSPLTLPWLKLTRTGNVFTGYLSTDGIVWTPVNSATIPMSDPILVGIAVTSHTNSNLATGTFDHLQIGPAQPSMLTLGSRQTNGGFGLSVQGQPGWKNRIEISPDLVHWTAWATQFNGSGLISINDDSVAGVPRRFYRAVVLP